MATVKVNAVPAVSVTVAALLKAGGLPTVSVNAWLAVPVAFLAVKVSGYGPWPPPWACRTGWPSRWCWR